MSLKPLALLLIGVLIGCNAPPSRSVVVWISIDGLRHDYVDRYELPLLRRMMRDGAYSRQLAPVFPSLTFPVHISQATGVSPIEHGITSNVFYDSTTRELHKNPNESSLLQAEPLWVTAARQDVRSAVIDWPMSYAQQGSWRADYFEAKFDKDRVDAQRLDRLLQVWEEDSRDPPLRLLMGYVASVDSAGHDYGPDAPELARALASADLMLEGFIARAQRIFRAKMRPNDRLYFLFTTDHGMSPLHTQRVLEDVLGERLSQELFLTQAGNIANIFLNGSQNQDAIIQRLKTLSFARVWKRGELPENWHYAHPTRTGDIVVSLDVGYAFKSKPQETTQPTTQKAPPKGGHGYPVEDDPNMMGFMVIWSPGVSLGGRDLGKVDSLQLHPTVAKLLGIAPAPHATARAIELR